MYHRRRVLLNLIAAFGDQGVGKIKLQKTAVSVLLQTEPAGLRLCAL